MYLVNCTRPGISLAVNLLARYNASLIKRRWVGVKNIFRYPLDTIDLGLLYEKNQDMIMVGYCDVGYILDPHNPRSQTGFCLLE